MMKEPEIEIIETLDENGNIVKFELYDIIEYNDKEYALLIPVDSEDEEEVIVMGLIDNDGEYEFRTIDDEQEFQEVSEFIESLED
ncbi:DUF1292 domain-containing protein [bacterium]|nr:DUF1292 domain-containing protein [bacterium]